MASAQRFLLCCCMFLLACFLGCLRARFTVVYYTRQDSLCLLPDEPVKLLGGKAGLVWWDRMDYAQYLEQRAGFLISYEPPESDFNFAYAWLQRSYKLQEQLAEIFGTRELLKDLENATDVYKAFFPCTRHGHEGRPLPAEHRQEQAEVAQSFQSIMDMAMRAYNNARNTKKHTDTGSTQNPKAEEVSDDEDDDIKRGLEANLQLLKRQATSVMEHVAKKRKAGVELQELFRVTYESSEAFLKNLEELQAELSQPEVPDDQGIELVAAYDGESQDSR